MASGWAASNFPAIVLLVVGVILFGTASTGIANWYGTDLGGAGESPIGLYNVQWATSDRSAGTENVASFASATVEFDVSDPNITAVTFKIRCQENNAQFPFNYQVQIRGPHNASASSPSGSCATPRDIVVPVTAVPSANQTTGADEDAARAALEDPNATRAVGGWTVTISGSRTTVTGPLTMVIGPPSGSVELVVKKWSAALTPVLR